MGIMVGSARHDENGKYCGGAAGDQLQKSSNNDIYGEVSMQAMYTHKKGWCILRPKSVPHANAIAQKMRTACNNGNIGYDQNQRLGIISRGVNSSVKTECDCSSLVRECIKEATGKDPGNFTTANEKSALLKTNLFDDKGSYVSQAKTPVYNGDVLVTKTKGHTVIVVTGSSRAIGATTSGTTSGSSGKTYTGTFPALPPRGYYIYGDGFKTLTDYKTQIKRIQSFLDWAISAGLTADGCYGNATVAAVKTFQQEYGLTADGSFGKNTLAKAKTVKK